MNFVKPTFRSVAFNCPFCQAYSHQLWGDAQIYRLGSFNSVPNTMFSYCVCCSTYSIWVNGELVYPEPSLVLPPNVDLNVDIKRDYEEASKIVLDSPRGAAALLRLAIQKLCVQLGERGDDLNTVIGNLVKKGLPPKIQRSLDYVRVIGNEAVHPGVLDLKDNQETALKLFELINLIADVTITKPNEIEKLYTSLPTEKIKSIEKRDKK